MSWHLVGNFVEAVYMGQAQVEGVVVESRVKYGGKVQHTVKLNKPVQLRWRSEPTEILLIDDEEILRKW